MTTCSRWLLAAVLFFPLVVNGGLAVAETPVAYSRQIRPILAKHCIQCHGPDEEAREGGLRLDEPTGDESPFAERGDMPVITPGDPQLSLLWQRVTAADPADRMPPADSHTGPLSADELALLRRWIEGGAKYDRHWAFDTPRKQPLPAVENSDWTAGPIDRFVLAKVEHAGMQPQPEATPRQLIRRLTLDLTGLPPTRAEIDAYLRDTSPAAHIRLVDRLMASPRYGEHMAKYWLDLVRFADTNGIHHDHYREMTPYRDWVIRAFNENLPYDDFTTYQLAGDLFEEPSIDQQIASGFHRLHLVIDKGTALPEESFARNVIDRTTAVGTTFMGLTVQCAVCHDHKYDPLTQRDFYQLFAFFNNIDAPPETPGKNIHEPALRLPSAAQAQELRHLEAEIRRLQAEVAEYEPSVAARENFEERAEVSKTATALDTEIEDNQTELASLREELVRLEQRKAEVESQVRVTLVMRERDTVRPTFVLIRGAYDQPGEPVNRGTPSFLPPLTVAEATPSRRDLAAWLTSGDHPLTARVAVNRFWQQFFGVGLVKTSEDFGTQGEFPSHPELLDRLAVDFVQSGWNVKELVRSIVTSQTYRQSSRAPSAAFEADPRNRLLARGSRFRLDAEVIRDQLLAISGQLESAMYGRSVKPPQPPGLWKDVSMVSSSTYAFEPDRGAKIVRRSLYTFWKRALPPPQMTIFDAPTRESCIARRERTNTPLQALVLMNEKQAFGAAKQFALKLLREVDDDEAERLRVAYEMVTSQLPDAAELRTLQTGLQSLRKAYAVDPRAAQQLTQGLALARDLDPIEVAAYIMVANALFNLDATKTRE